MATHDYVIANGTGSAVRSDLNNALAAIVSNNSSSSEPSTKYAYQWWADTTTGQLKLRNSANNGWVTIFELDGTMLMEDGTVSAPGLAFASDLNTGFFRSAADKINFATGGVERLEIGSSEVVFNDGSNDVDFRVESNGNTHMLFVDGGNDRVGIGTSSPGLPLDIVSNVSSETVRFRGASGGTGTLRFTSNDAGTNYAFIQSRSTFFDIGSSTSIPLLFSTNGTEAARIDTSGRLGIGTSSMSSFSTYGNKLVVHGTGTDGPGITISSGTGDTASLFFADGTSGAETHRGSVAYAHSTDSLIFGTASTTRMQIDSSGNVLIGTTSVGGSGGTTLRANGLIAAPAVYSVGLSASPRDAFIDQNGEFGYVPSIREAKTNIQVQNNVDWLYQLEPVTFNYKAKDRETGEYTGTAEAELEYGLIAEDVEAACPDLCFYDQTDNGPELRGVSYKKLITPMLKALQDARVEIETLKTKVAALEAG